MTSSVGCFTPGGITELDIRWCSRPVPDDLLDRACPRHGFPCACAYITHDLFLAALGQAPGARAFPVPAVAEEQHHTNLFPFAANPRPAVRCSHDSFEVGVLVDFLAEPEHV